MWSVKSLAQLEKEGLVQLGRGKIISKKDLFETSGTYPVYSSSKVGDGKFGEYGMYMFDEELITWSVDGGGRLFHREKHKFSITNVTGFLRILDSSVLSYKYLFYALSLLHSRIKFDWVKKAHPSVLRKEYLDIPVPPLAEQQRIVAKLDAAFAEIDRAIQIQSMRAQEASNLKASLLTASLNDDARAWKSVTIGDLYNVGSSKRVLKADWKTSGIPFYRGREITKLSVDGYVENDLFITDEHYRSLSSKSGVPNTDDIMITAIGTIGNTYIVQPNDKFYFKDASVLWLRKQADVSSKYVQYWLKTDGFFSQLDKGNGATVDTLTIKKLASVELPFPPLAEQQRIVAMLDTVFSEIEAIASALSATKANYSLLKSTILAQELQPSVAA